jgi:hypothetical protein
MKRMIAFLLLFVGMTLCIWVLSSTGNKPDPQAQQRYLATGKH